MGLSVGKRCRVKCARVAILLLLLAGVWCCYFVVASDDARGGDCRGGHIPWFLFSLHHRQGREVVVGGG